MNDMLVRPSPNLPRATSIRRLSHHHTIHSLDPNSALQRVKLMSHYRRQLVLQFFVPNPRIGVPPTPRHDSEN
jgi:hypothetical protein